MSRWVLLFVLAAVSAPAGNLLAAGQAPARPAIASPSSPQSNEAPPTTEEIRARTKILIANQHGNDRAIEEYERVELETERGPGMNPHVLGSKKYRVVPTGFGPYRILLRQDGNDVGNIEYRRELQRWEDALQLALNPSDSRTSEIKAKFEKKQRDRAELVDAMQEAFIPHWIGREMREGRFCDIVVLDPNPEYRPHSLLQEALSHVTVKIWVDHAANQLVRGEATITRDISIGGGIFGKLYRGGVIAMDQQEFAPGVWLPVRLQYDYTIRKFLFTSEEHKLVEISRYRRLGSPKEALAVVRSELAKPTPERGDP